jgi:superoxide reductase
MDRRHFLLKSAAVAATTPVVTLVSTVQATETATHLPPMNLIFTQDNAGKWEKKKGSHLPKIKVANGKVKVSTKHSQSEDHFIVRHTLLLSDGTVLGSKTFSPEIDPVSEYELPAGYKGSIFATSFCNRHDLWLADATI